MTNSWYLFKTNYFMTLTMIIGQDSILDDSILNRTKSSFLYVPLRSKKQGDLRNSFVLLEVTALWHVAKWVSRAPPHHTIPTFLNLNGIIMKVEFWLAHLLRVPHLRAAALLLIRWWRSWYFFEKSWSEKKINFQCHIKPQIARDFSLMIQSIGMVAAAASIILARLQIFD